MKNMIIQAKQLQISQKKFQIFLILKMKKMK